MGSILLQVSGLKTKFPYLFLNKHTDWNLPDFTIYVHFAFMLRNDDKKQKYCGYYFQPLSREEKEMQDLKHQHEVSKEELSKKNLLLSQNLKQYLKQQINH